MRALVVLLLVIVCFDGFGRAFRLIALPSLEVPPGILPALGLALFLAACGPIELLHLGDPRLFTAILACGLACEAIILGPRALAWLARIRQVPAALSRSGWRLPIWLAAAAILLLVFLRWSYAAYNIWDDYQGYLVFPSRILQQGWLGDDIFDLRRVEMGLGGASYLSALFLTVLDVSEIRVVDAGIGAAVLFLLLFGLARTNRLAGWAGGVLFGLSVFLVVLAPLVNTSAHLSGGALIVAFLVCMRQWHLQPARSGSILVGLLLAGAAILKAQYLIPAVVLPLSTAGYRTTRERTSSATVATLWTGMVALLVLLPWMAASYRSVGTPFFPFLGAAMSHSGAVGHAASAATILLHIGHNLSYCAAAALLAFAIARATDPARGALAIILAGNILVYVVLFNILLSAYAFRYYYSFCVIPLLFLVAEFCGTVSREAMLAGARRPVAWATALAFGVFLVRLAMGADSDREVTAALASLPSDAAAHLADPDPIGNDIVLGSPLFLRSAVFRARADAIHRLQRSVSPHEPLVALLDLPFVLDFGRQPIYVLDFPGAAGPGNGVPYQGPAEDLAVYLRSHALRYLAFASFNQAFHSPKTFQTLSDSESYVLQTVAARTLAVQSRIATLKSKYPLVYDDGQSFVLDLGT